MKEKNIIHEVNKTFAEIGKAQDVINKIMDKEEDRDWRELALLTFFTALVLDEAKRSEDTSQSALSQLITSIAEKAIVLIKDKSVVREYYKS